MRFQKTGMLLLPVLFFSQIHFGFCQYITAEDTVKVDYELDPVIVTATKTEHAQRDLAASISLITKSRIDMSLTASALEAVQSVPGFYLTQSGVMGFGIAGQAAGKISIRGAGGGANTHVLILRNGRPDFMGLMGCTVADEFTSEGVERIEVIRGPGSFLYGTNATGGIINIITRQMRTEGFETRLRTGGGSFGSREFTLAHGGKINKIDYYMTAAQRNTDGHRKGSDYAGRHFTARFGIQLSGNTKLDWNANLADMTVNDPGQVQSPQTGHWYDMLRYGGDMNLSHKSGLGETQIKLHGNFGTHDFYDGWYSTDRTLGLLVYHNIKPWQGHTMTIGLDWKRYGGEAKDPRQEYGAFFITEYGPYAHFSQLLFGRMIVSAGLRAENHELYGWETLPKAGAVYHFSHSLSIRASLAKGFRSPSIRELYFWMPANEALTPDRVWSREIGINLKHKEVLNLDLAVYQINGSNLIQFSGPPPRWVNGGEYTHTGFEASLDWMPTKRLHLNSTVTHMELSDFAFNIPSRKYTGSARYDAGWFSAAVECMVVQDLTGADFSGPSPQPVLVSLDDWAVFNGSVLVPVANMVSLQIFVNNIFNQEYQSMYEYPMPGRYIMGRLEIGF